jgi:hypothetical protein
VAALQGSSFGASGTFRGSIWWAVAAIVLVAIVYEYDAAAGGILIVLVVLGMLLVASRTGTVNLSAA